MHILLSMLLFCFAGTINEPNSTGAISAQIVGMRNNTGVVRIGLYTKSNFLEVQNQLFGTRLFVQNGKAFKLVENLPPGKYAMSVLHDENDNNEMDFRFLLPSEGCGFTNNPKLFLSRPSFETCSFEVKAGVTSTVQIQMKYF